MGGVGDWKLRGDRPVLGSSSSRVRSLGSRILIGGCMKEKTKGVLHQLASYARKTIGGLARGYGTALSS